MISPLSHDDDWRLNEASWPQTAYLLHLRHLTTSDIPAFRALRLDALRLHPEVFIPTYEEERAVDPSTIAPRFRDEWISHGNYIVGAESIAARRLYERLGFAAFGVEPQAIKLDDRYVDVVLKSRHVGSASHAA